MHPQRRLPDEVGMIIRDLEIVNRLRLTRRNRNKPNRRPRTRDDGSANTQFTGFDKPTIYNVERMLARGLDSFAVGES